MRPSSGIRSNAGSRCHRLRPPGEKMGQIMLDDLPGARCASLRVLDLKILLEEECIQPAACSGRAFSTFYHSL